jgi:hypothetical protein
VAAYKPKTVATNDSIEDYLVTLDASQRKDSQTLINIMQEVSGESPVLWGTIIGFGAFHYKTKSGIEADWPKIGFAPRKGKLSLYITYDAKDFSTQLDRVGYHNIGKGCIYFKNLNNADLGALKDLIYQAYQQEFSPTT